MKKKLYMVTDLGPGDGGKGGVVHAISYYQKAHTIVKVGGAQGSHGVRTARGRSTAFQQFGCGTFEGVRTHISKRFVADPWALLFEADNLRREGVHDPFAYLTVSGDALCNTLFHTCASQLTELLWGDNPRGTIGSGVGQAYRLHESQPELSIHMRDLQGSGLREKLATIQQYYRSVFAAAFNDLDRFRMIDFKYVADARSRLMNDQFVDAVYDKFREFAAIGCIVPDEYLADKILRRPGVVVSESSHGILTDKDTGFHPHTSALRTLPRFIRGMYEEAGYDGEIVSLGVHRAYSIRHGAGPLPTHDPAMSEKLLPGSNKEENRWQGKVRVGPLDLVLLRYALAASGPDAYDGLAITWFDQIQKLGEWDVCDCYAFDAWRGETWPARNLSDMAETLYQDIPRLTTWLKSVRPMIESISLPGDADRDQLYGLVADTLFERLGVPVRMISFGPTERDKVLK